jgi:hypothetical protein
MKKIRGLVVGVLLAVWCFPALSSAKALPPAPVTPPALVAMGTTETGTNAASSAASSTNGQSAGLAQRERQASNLQDFKGGSAVIFIGSGTVLILLIVLLILLI